MMFSILRAILFGCYGDLYRFLFHQRAVRISAILLHTGFTLLSFVTVRRMNALAADFIPVLLCLSYADITEREIPDLCIIGCLSVIPVRPDPYLFEAVLVFLLFLPGVFFRKIGCGDVKLLAVWTLLAGSRISVVITLSGIFAMFAPLLRTDRKNGPFAFGPYLSLGFMVYLFLFHR